MASTASQQPPSSPPLGGGKRRVQFLTATSSSSTTVVVAAPSPARSIDREQSLYAAGPTEVVSAVVVQGFQHKGHYLCEECSDDTMAILLRKALEKRSRRVRMKRQLDRESSLEQDDEISSTKVDSYNRGAASLTVETY